MMLTVETFTPPAFADFSTARLSLLRPCGITGSVKDTRTSGRCCWSRAMALERSATDLESDNGGPSMSKSASVAPAASSAVA
jgi:hypothetical protein